MSDYVPFYVSNWIYPKFKVKFQPKVPFSLQFLSNLFGKTVFEATILKSAILNFELKIFFQDDFFFNLSSFLRWANFLNLV